MARWELLLPIPAKVLDDPEQSRDVTASIFLHLWSCLPRPLHFSLVCFSFFLLSVCLSLFLPFFYPDSLKNRILEEPLLPLSHCPFRVNKAILQFSPYLQNEVSTQMPGRGGGAGPRCARGLEREGNSTRVEVGRRRPQECTGHWGTVSAGIEDWTATSHQWSSHCYDREPATKNQSCFLMFVDSYQATFPCSPTGLHHVCIWTCWQQSLGTVF